MQEILRLVFKNKLFWAGLIIPLVFQLIYFSIALPALKDGNEKINNLVIAIVNEDAETGPVITEKISANLPFKFGVEAELGHALDRMEAGDYSMVINIPADFSAGIEAGQATMRYYINQATSSMTRQAMERTALTLNEQINEMAFNQAQNAIAGLIETNLSQAGLPENLALTLKAGINQPLSYLKYDSIEGEIIKVNNTEGFIPMVLPFFIFLTCFVGSTIMTLMHYLAFRPLGERFSRGRILIIKLGANLAISLVLPLVVILMTALFGLSFNGGTARAWFLLSAGFFTLLCLVQMFCEWFGLPGVGAAAVILFPLQLVSSGLMYSREILPAFYAAAGRYLPAGYIGDAALKLYYGGGSISYECRTLLLMSAVFLIIVFLTLLKRKSKQSAQN